MLTTYGTRPDHFDRAYPFTRTPRQRVGFKLGRWSEALLDSVAVFTGLALLVPSALVLFSPLIVAAIH